MLLNRCSLAVGPLSADLAASLQPSSSGNNDPIILKVLRTQQDLLERSVRTSGPGALQKMLVFGRNRTPGLDAQRRFTLEIFSSSQSELTCIDSICRGKVYDLLNKEATPRMSGDLWVAVRL